MFDSFFFCLNKKAIREKRESKLRRGKGGKGRRSGGGGSGLKKSQPQQQQQTPISSKKLTKQQKSATKVVTIQGRKFIQAVRINDSLTAHQTVIVVIFVVAS